MITLDATGTIDYLQEGRRKYYFVQAGSELRSWPFSSDAFPIHRGKSRNKKFKKGDRVSFKAVELKGDLRAWKISKLDEEDL